MKFFNWKVSLSTKKWAIANSIFLLILSIVILSWIINLNSPNFIGGSWNIEADEFELDRTYRLNGQWEFYWNRLLEPNDFIEGQIPVMNSYMIVPGSWTDKVEGQVQYPHHGFATYRMHLTVPEAVKDPAIKIRRVSRALKLYANEQLIVEIGKVSSVLSEYKAGYDIIIKDLPNGKNDFDIIIQIANFDYAKGGIRESFLFGSRMVMQREQAILLAIQLLVLGGILSSAIYYLIMFLIQRYNATAFLFSLLCIDSVLRAMIWGESPILVFLPEGSVNAGIYLNFITGYVLIPIILLFIRSIYPSIYSKRWTIGILMPNLFFILLLFNSLDIISRFTDLFYILLIIQCLYIFIGLFKALLGRLNQSLVLFYAMGFMFIGMLVDMINYKNLINTGLTYTTPIGNFAFIIAMSYIQSKQQEGTYRKLILYNEKLVETDRLKEKIIATENAFLQAQIKPHFIFNALNSIASLAYIDAKKTSDLIGRLSIYLRNIMYNENLNLTVDLDKELELVDAYIFIEEARFNELVVFERDIPPDISFRLPHIAIQPLIENAVKHGLKNCKEGIKVKLTITDKGTYYEILVTDNGKGIETKKLEMLLNVRENNRSIGLINIHTRLLRLYGDGLHINSEINCGTQIMFKIPKEEKNDQSHTH